MIIIPGEDGEMAVLPNHAPLLSNLRFGVVEVRTGEEELFFTVAGGVVEVLPNIVTILADAAENVEEIDISRAEEARNRAEQMLREGPPVDEDVYERIERSLRKSQLRLDAAQRYRRSGRTSIHGQG